MRANSTAAFTRRFVGAISSNKHCQRRGCAAGVLPISARCRRGARTTSGVIRLHDIAEHGDAARQAFVPAAERSASRSWALECDTRRPAVSNRAGRCPGGPIARSSR